MSLLPHNHDGSCQCPCHKRQRPEPGFIVEVLDRLLTSARADSKMDEMSNEQIAALLIEHVWGRFDVLSVESALLSQASERLRRSHNK